MADRKHKAEIDKRRAREIFGRAFRIAQSGNDVPEEWLERTRHLSGSPSKTFIPMLGTALLAKATNRFVDALSLRASESHKSYSARSLAKDVLVPCAKESRLNIATTGAEPLNNQPFLRADRVSLDLKVTDNARPFFEYLHRSLEAADFLEGDTALMALAAFMRARLELVPIPEDWGASLDVSLIDAGRAIRHFHESHSEGGRVGQALVCAALDGFFDDVRTRKVNDPSNKVPGDVGVWNEGRLVIAGEVKQRPFKEHEIRQFGERLRAAKVYRGFVAALAQGNEPLATETLVADMYQRHGVIFRLYAGVDEILNDAAFFTAAANPHEIVRGLPARGYSRLLAIEVSPNCLAAYKQTFNT